MRRRVTILGSTGSIGRSTLSLLADDPGRYEVVALVAGSDAVTLAAQARAMRPQFVALADPAGGGELGAALAGSGIRWGAGPSAVLDAVALDADWVMSAIVGAAGLAPTLAAVKAGRVVALANKEALVCAGALVTEAAAASGARILPVDSEHNAIFQVFDFDRPCSVERVVLTASGGPFRTWGPTEMAQVTPEQALRHPNWSMGSKITVDSASMMNKGLEFIEACHLFPVRPEQVEIIVHPESIVHSMVAYRDGSVLAQLGVPDMRTPISVTLCWPERTPVPDCRLDLVSIGRLTFEALDESRFPAPGLARAALSEGGMVPCALNAANEEAVAAFLEGRIGFLDIARIVERVMAVASRAAPRGIEDVFAADTEARIRAAEAIGCRPQSAELRAAALGG